jgi:FixJ family two-component response regulator
MPDDEPLVVVIDDDEAICRAVSRMLGAEGFSVRTFTSARAYLDESDASMPACVLVDLRMPDVDGLALIRALRASGGGIATVVMTGTGHIPTVVEAMKEGAVDLLAKPFTADALNDAIERATATARRTRNEQHLLADLWRIVEQLTPREAEVCGLVACGLLNKRIGALIGTKEKTVKVHRGRVMQKLHVASVAELVRLVDELRGSASRSLIRVDGVDILRPRAADVIIAVVAKERARATLAIGDPAVDQRTIPRLQ